MYTDDQKVYDEAQQNLRRNVLRLTAERNLSIVKAAGLAGVDRKTVQRVVYSKRYGVGITLRSIAKLASLFGVSVAELLSEDAPTPPPERAKGRVI